MNLQNAKFVEVYFAVTKSFVFKINVISQNRKLVFPC